MMTVIEFLKWIKSQQKKEARQNKLKEEQAKRRAAKEAARRARRQPIKKSDKTKEIKTAPYKQFIPEWDKWSRYSTKQVRNKLKELQREAEKRIRTATKAQMKIERAGWKDAQEALKQVKRGRLTEQQYRNQMLKQMAVLARFLSTQSSTKAGLNAWADHMRQAIERATGESAAHLDLAELQKIGELMNYFRNAAAVNGYVYESDTTMSSAFQIYTKQMKDGKTRPTLQDLKDKADELMTIQYDERKERERQEAAAREMDRKANAKAKGRKFMSSGIHFRR